jgi:hypothetical protein
VGLFFTTARANYRILRRKSSGGHPAKTRKEGKTRVVLISESESSVLIELNSGGSI